MKTKKILTVVLIMIMVISSMSITAFAAEEVYPNFYGSVNPSNYDCVCKADLEVSVKISKEGMEDLVIPITYNEEVEEYAIEEVVEGVDDILREVGPAYDAVLTGEDGEFADALTVMQDLGYNVEVFVEDNNAEHEFLLEDADIYVDVLTYTSVKTTLDELIAMLEELILEYDPSYEPMGTFDAFLEAYKAMLLDPEGGDLTEEEAAEEMAEVVYVENMFAALQSGEYAGELLVMVSVPCECPELIEYTLYHEYYDENGEFVAQEMEFPRVANGEVISVDDLTYVTEYDGVEYEVEGVYLVDTETYEADWDNPVEEFTAVDYYDEETDEWFWTEVIIKYVPKEADPIIDEGDQNTGDGGETVPGPEPTPDPTPDPEDKPNTNVPLTGDEANLGLYMALMLAAVFVMKKVKA